MPPRGRAFGVDWLVTSSRVRGDGYFAPLLDYPAEDRWLAVRMAGAG
jgi:hypothetical protein